MQKGEEDVKQLKARQASYEEKLKDQKLQDQVRQGDVSLRDRHIQDKGSLTVLVRHTVAAAAAGSSCRCKSLQIVVWETLIY